MKPCPNRCYARDGDIQVNNVSISTDDVRDWDDGYQVECRCCHMSGPLGGSEQHAVRLWDGLPRRGDRRPNPEFGEGAVIKRCEVGQS